MVLRRLGRRPALDWYFSLSFISILFIIAIILSGVLYYDLIIKTGPPVVPTNETPLVFDREALDKAIEHMNQSDQNAGTLPSAVLADPS